MPRPQVPPRKRPAPVEEVDEPSSSDGDEDPPEELTRDQLRALKRMKANMDNDDDEDSSEPEEDGVDDGGGADAASDEEDDQDEEEDDDDDTVSDKDDSEDEDDERTLEEQVADVPFEVLETLRQDGRGLVGQAARAAAARATAAERSFKRAHKDRPQEVSSKRPVGRFREVIQVPHKEVRDPRFESSSSGRGSSGAPQQAADSFRRRYAFVYNDMLPAEKSELQDKIKKEKNPKSKAQLQAQLQRISMQLRDEDLRRRTQVLEKEWKSKERTAVSGGKTPFFLKDSDKKRLALLAKYQELKERGKLDKFMEKRRKKNAAKDHRYLPSGRRQQQDS